MSEAKKHPALQNLRQKRNDLSKHSSAAIVAEPKPRAQSDVRKGLTSLLAAEFNSNGAPHQSNNDLARDEFDDCFALPPPYMYTSVIEMVATAPAMLS